MKVLVVGATGHIGSYLVPRLISAGYEVTGVARKTEAKHAPDNFAWDAVNWVVADCRKEEESGTWKSRLEQIDCDIVVDLLTFNVDQAKLFVDAFKGRVLHFLHCGSIWAYGPSNRVPHLESYPRNPTSSYGQNKTAVENYLMGLFSKENFPVTVIHPGHISGKKWLPIDPQGSINGVKVYEQLALGQEVYLPGNGMDALHHVHADDVAQVFELAIANRASALGQTFSAVAPYGMTLKGCCKAVAGLFGKETNLKFVDVDEFRKMIGDKACDISLSHICESVIASCEKARKLLGFQPRYTTEQIYAECLQYLIETGQLKIN